MAGQKSEALPDGVEPDPVNMADPAGRALHLSKTTVVPGEIITRTIQGANNHSDITSVIMTLEHFQRGSWRTIYYLWLLSPPEVSVPKPYEIIPAVGIGPAAAMVKIPDVPPGTYRVRQDIGIGSATAPPTPITLYAIIDVTSP